MRTRGMYFAVSIFAALFAGRPAPARAQATASPQGPVKITLDDAIQMALAHNHTLQAERVTIQENEAQEITANLRPDPDLVCEDDAVPAFIPNQFDSSRT